MSKVLLRAADNSENGFEALEIPYIWWSFYLVVIIFGGVDRNCHFKKLTLKFGQCLGVA